jgi:hypothetical protein
VPSHTFQFEFQLINETVPLREPQTEILNSIEQPPSNQNDKNVLHQEPIQTLEFIDLSTRSKRQQAKNRIIVRSHVTRAVRRAQRQRQEPNQQDIVSSVVPKDMVSAVVPKAMVSSLV